MITIYDIAKELNISPSTVSRTFSNPKLVKEKTRRMVLKKADEMGYQLNMVASQLRNQSSNIIALVSLQTEWSWYTDILANGVREEAWKAGYEVILLNGNIEHTDSLLLCEKMRFAGVIVASTELGKGAFYTSENLPVVYINRIIKGKNSVLTDDKYEICQEMDYLKRMGHSKIGFINGPETSIHSQLRYDAYLEKMHEFGYEICSEWIKKGDWSFKSAYLCTKEILNEKEYPTAIMVANDQMSAGVYHALREKDLIPGEDISVVGHDNVEYSDYLAPPLTTASIPLYDMGKKAGQLLLDQIHGDTIEKEVKIRGELIIRESVKDISGNI